MKVYSSGVNMIKFAIFDVGGVIVGYHSEEVPGFFISLGASPEKVKEFLSNENWKQNARGKITEEQLYERTENLLNVKVPIEKYEESYTRNLTSENTPKVIEIIKQLKVQIAILTDTNELQNRIVDRMINLEELTPHIFKSNEIGMMKEDPGTFTFVINKLNINPEEAVMIDDSPEKIQRAQEEGLKTILYKNPEQLREELEALNLL